MRRLNQTLLAGGVVYPAGTREDAIEVAVVRDDVWDDVDIEVPDSVLSAEVTDSPVAAELRECIEYLIEAHLADKDTTVAELLAHAVEVYGEPVAAEGDEDIVDAELVEDEDEDDEQGALPPIPVVEKPAYADLGIADLKAQAEARDLEFEGTGANGNIVKADHAALVAALEADDETSAEG